MHVVTGVGLGGMLVSRAAKTPVASGCGLYHHARERLHARGAGRDLQGCHFLMKFAHLCFNWCLMKKWLMRCVRG